MSDQNKITPQSIIDKLMSQHEADKKGKEIIIEREADYKKALNGMARTVNGNFFLKYLIRYCKVFEVEEDSNPAKLYEDRSRRNIYLKFIRPYLDDPTKAELECQKI